MAMTYFQSQNQAGKVKNEIVLVSVHSDPIEFKLYMVVTESCTHKTEQNVLECFVFYFGVYFGETIDAFSAPAKSVYQCFFLECCLAPVLSLKLCTMIIIIILCVDATFYTFTGVVGDLDPIQGYRNV